MTERTDPPNLPASEFICPGCGRPLAITLRSDMCFAEAQVYCDDCERDYQQRRGKWAEVFAAVGESEGRWPSGESRSGEAEMREGDPEVRGRGPVARVPKG